MFCGMGRLLGSLFSGPLSALGRSPGSSKVSRVCLHTLEDHDQEDQDKGQVPCQVFFLDKEHVQGKNDQDDNKQYWYRVKSLFKRGHNLLQNGAYIFCHNIYNDPTSNSRLRKGSLSDPLNTSELNSKDTVPREYTGFVEALFRLWKPSDVICFAKAESEGLSVIKPYKFLSPNLANGPNVSVKSAPIKINLSQDETTIFSDSSSPVKTKPSKEIHSVNTSLSNEAQPRIPNTLSGVLGEENKFKFSNRKLEVIVKLENSSQSEGNNSKISFQNLSQSEEFKSVELDLIKTKHKMDAKLDGIHGLDLLLSGQFKAGFQKLVEAARRGDSESLYNLGVIFENGHGKEKNLFKAVKCYKSAVKRNHPAAMYNLAIIYDKGLAGGPPDHDQAKRLFFKAAELGLPEAVKLFKEAPNPIKETNECHLCKENGWTQHESQIPTSKPASFKYLKDLCTLARSYRFGISGMPVDKMYALELYRMASEYSADARNEFFALEKEIGSKSEHSEKTCLVKRSLSSPSLSESFSDYSTSESCALAMSLM